MAAPTLRFLLIDDDEEQRVLLDLVLARTRLEYRLDWCSSVADALEHVTTVHYDLCFVDYLLEEQTGLDFIVAAAARGIDVPMVMITSHDGDGLAVRALEAGAADYLVKGAYDADTLERTVRYTIERARITGELRRREEQLRRSEERMRLTVAGAPIAIFAGDADGVIEFSEGKVLATLGLSSHELVGASVETVFAGNEQALIGLRTVLAGERFMGIVELAGVFLECSAEPRFDASGEVTGFVGVATDVTARVGAERERASLERSVERERLRIARLVESLPVVVWEAEYGSDGQLHQTYVSDYIEALSGYTPAEWLADPDLWIGLVHPDDRGLLDVPLEELSGPGVAQRRYRLIRRDGSLAWIDVRFSLMYGPVGEIAGLRGVVVDVTEQTLTEQRLRSSERLFDSFLNNSPILNFIKDEEGRYVVINEAFAGLVGRDASEIIGRDDTELFTAEVAAAFRRNDRIVMAAGRAMEFTERTFEEGREIISHVVKFPIHAHDGTRLLGGLAVDITRRVEAETELRKSEERFLLSARATDDTVYDWNLVTNEIWWNENLEKRYGYRPGEEPFDIEWWKRHVHPEDHDVVVSNLEEAIARGDQHWRAEYRFRRADGGWAYVLERGYMLYSREGSPLRMIGAIIDVSDSVAAEEELRRREEEYRRIVETAQEGIWVTDNRGVTTFVNATMARMLGHSIEGMLGTKFEVYLDDEARELARRNKERRQRGLAEKYDLRMMRADGSPIWTIVSANPIFDRAGELIGSLAMVTDITERKRADAALREAHDLLEHRVAERTAELAAAIRQLEQAHHAQKRFVADASHDLRTPLTVVRAELDLLLASGDLDEQVRRSLERAAGEVRRLDHLASDLLALATVDSEESGTPRFPARLDELLLESIANLTPIARDRHIVWNIDIDDAVEIACNREALRRAVANVLENALKYSPRDSAVTVRFSRVNGVARLVVADEGIGIAPEDLPRVYDRFYRSDAARSTPGTGLGLPIVKTVIESHGGSIDIASTPGKGTTVTITIPTTSSAA